jgi:hypothetical protein
MYGISRTADNSIASVPSAHRRELMRASRPTLAILVVFGQADAQQGDGQTLVGRSMSLGPQKWRRQQSELRRSPPGFKVTLFAHGLKNARIRDRAKRGHLCEPPRMQLAFYKAHAFRPEYVGDAFATMRGSWNRATASGYEIVRIHFVKGPPQSIQPFVSGFLTDNGTHIFLHKYTAASVASRLRHRLFMHQTAHPLGK